MSDLSLQVSDQITLQDSLSVGEPTAKPPSHLEETKGLPSASNIEMYFACNGAYLLGREVPEHERFTGDAAEAGQRIHKAVETGDLDHVDGIDEESLTETIAQKCTQIYEQWIEDKKIKDAECFRERRYWLKMGSKEMFSAKVDFVAVSKEQETCLIIDLKSGRKAVTPAVRNWQLRSALVLIAKEHGLKSGRVAIAQPFVFTQVPCDYSQPDIFGGHGAQEQLYSLLNRINRQDSPRRTGLHCLYCPAKHICPEALKLVANTTALTGLRWELQTPQRKLELWEESKLAVTIATHIQNNIRAELEANPAAIPNLEIGPPVESRAISDPIVAFLKMMEASTPKNKNISEDIQSKIRMEVQKAFCEMTKLSVGALEEWAWTKLSFNSKKEMKLWFAKTFADCMTTTTKKGSIKRKELQP